MLRPELAEQFYSQFCCQILWRLFHNMAVDTKYLESMPGLYDAYLKVAGAPCEGE